MKKTRIATFSELDPARPFGAVVGNVDLVIVRWPDEDQVSVLYGRCLHRGALLADGEIRGEDLICGVHEWDYRFRTGVSAYSNDERLERFTHWIEDGGVFVDEDEIREWERCHPQPYDRTSYQGAYGDPKGTPDEPFNHWIQEMAEHGLERAGHHGRVDAMGVPRAQLPSWDDIQIVTAQLHRVPLLDDAEVGSELVIGPEAKRPLRLEIPLFVSDMSFGALSLEAKVALAKGAEEAGTGICSGEGGMLPEEQQENARYLYELASGRFGFSMEKLSRVQAFHFKCGQGAKTGTGGHLPGHKVTGRIAEVRGLPEGQAAISPARFPDLESVADFRRVADEVREATGGIPIGFKLSAQHVERDVEAAVEAGADYIILDGRGGGTGAAPLLFRNNISVPTIPALARARRKLDALGRPGVSLIATGGLRVPSDFVKALALGADGVAVSNAAIQAIGCLGMRACHTNNCPVGIATQKEHLRARLPIDLAAKRLARFLGSATELMRVLARACGHSHLRDFCLDDLVTWKRDMHELSGVPHAGVGVVSARAWQPLGVVAPDQLVDARLQLHHAAQIVASVGKTFLAPRSDDGHPNLGWLASRRALAGHPIPGNPGFQAALELAPARLLLLEADGEVAEAFALAGERLAAASAWLGQAIADRFERALPSGLTSAGYELPAHAVGQGASFTADPNACAELACWFDSADAVLADRAARTEAASEVRCWPHHFDLATLVTVERGAGGAAAKTVGIGLSPGDGSYPEPYWYVSPWPYPDASVGLPELPGGHWHREGFTAAILTGSDLVSGGPDAAQGDRLGAFLDSAWAASRGLHGL